MPRKQDAQRPAENKPVAGGYEQFEFLNLELSQAEREALKKMPLWNDEWSQLLDKASAQGFTFSLKVDGFNKCFGAYMQIRLRTHPCYGFILTGRGSSQIKALRQVLYKHWVILEGDWSKVPGAQPAPYDD